MSVQRIQDSLHGLMEFRGSDSAVVDVLRAGELQRLRRIRQTGLAHLVYPAAEHSRLAHSLGVAYLGTRFSRQLEEASASYLTSALRPGAEARRDFALACLCHDLGHGPLSHVWEKYVVKGFDRPGWCAALGLDGEGLEHLGWHELVSQALLAWDDGDLHKELERLEKGTSLRVRRLLAGRYYLPYLARLIDGDVDCDRCDYIARDARQAGVAYGRFDLAWLISTVRIGANATGELVAGFDARKAVRVVEQFFVARRAMYDTVYHHRTVRAAESMVGLFLRRLGRRVRETGVVIGDDSGLLRPYQKLFENGVLSPEDVVKLDDYTLWTLIGHVANGGVGDTTLEELARRLVNRDLFKEAAGGDRRTVAELRPDIAEVISRRLGVDGEDFYEIDSAAFVMFDDPSRNVAGTDEQTDKRAYFVRGHGDPPTAFHVMEEAQIKDLTMERELQRVFVPREAKAEVEKLLRDHSGR